MQRAWREELEDAARGGARAGDRGQGASRGCAPSLERGGRVPAQAPRAPRPPAAGIPAGRHPDELRARLAVEQDKHSAAAHRTRENKARYLGRARLQGAGGRRVEGSYTHSPGAAPDMADLVIRATGQWAINVARGSERFVRKAAGSIPKTGHVDYARLDIAPAPGLGEPHEVGGFAASTWAT